MISSMATIRQLRYVHVGSKMVGVKSQTLRCVGSPFVRPLMRFVRFQSTDRRILVNNLKDSLSPYLHSHSNNPVAWQQWTDETLEVAKKEQKPVFLSIGYHTCHWCHVMNDESFSNDRIASILNENFIPIKVDREERPDVDAVYMMYLQASAGRGGWPLNVFLDPVTLNPFFGGTYWAGPETEGRNEKFEDVLTGVLNVWKEDPKKCRDSASNIASRLKSLLKAQNEAASTEFRLSLFTDVKEHFDSTFDRYNGGFGDSPKFPCAHNLSFLLRYGSSLISPEEKIEPTKKTPFQESLGPLPESSSQAIFTLQNIGKGGIKDQLSHGFARYSVTHDWSLPHFEKMLYDQALLLQAYLDAWIHDKSQNAFALTYARDIALYLTEGPLVLPNGGFYSAEDADSVPPGQDTSKKTEGAYYVWTYEEFFKPLDRLEGDFAAMRYNIQQYGNVDSQFDIQNELSLQNVLSIAATPQEIGKTFGKSEQYVEQVLESARSKLLDYRQKTRQMPEIDKKVVTCWNGLAIGALARAGILLRDSDPDLAAKCLTSAANTAAFIRAHLYDEQTNILSRLFAFGQTSKTEGMNEDYAFLISGLLDLYETSFDSQYLLWAKNLQEKQFELFWDSDNGGFFSVPVDIKHLILRPKSGFDGAEPSSNGVSCSNLYRLSGLLHDRFYEDKAVDILNCYGKDLAAQPFGYCSMLGSVIARLTGTETIILVGQGTKEEEYELLNVIWQHRPPNSYLVRVDASSIGQLFEPQGMAFYGALDDLYGQGPLKVLICRNYTCEAPLSTVEEVFTALKSRPGLREIEMVE